MSVNKHSKYATVNTKTLRQDSVWFANGTVRRQIHVDQSEQMMGKKELKSEKRCEGSAGHIRLVGHK